MGADLITYFCYGPKKLSEKKIPKAVAQAKAAVALAKTILEMEDLREAGKMTEEAFAQEMGALDQSPLRHLMGGIESKRSITLLVTEDNFHELRVIEQLDPDAVVHDLLHIWNHGSRDSTWRPVPGHRNLIGLVAGEMSWGDEPDGYGYQTLKNASLVGILPIFGVK